eukprot:scaffold110740_cov67-Phaeocystis_antarctica.AAC.1
MRTHHGHHEHITHTPCTHHVPPTSQHLHELLLAELDAVDGRDEVAHLQDRVKRLGLGLGLGL